MPVHRVQRSMTMPRRPEFLSFRVLQISGISLITLSFMNAMFLGSIGWMVNLSLASSGFLLLLVSFMLWNRYQRILRRKLIHKSY